MMTIISNIMDGIVFVDRGDAITLINPVAEELLGVKAFLGLGRKMSEVAQDDNQELMVAVAADHAKVLEDEASPGQCQTIEFHHADRDLVYIKSNTTRVLDYKGDFAGILTVLQDVTAEYKSDQLKNQYLSIVAHELRTPLTGIKTFSSLMSKGTLGPLTEMQDRAILSIKEQSVRLEHQIDKLINLGCIESNEYAQDLVEFSVEELITDAVLPFEVVADDSGVRLEHLVAPGLSVRGDRSDVKRALQALIENAVKFTPEGGLVTVSAEEIDGRVNFIVADSGIGINPRYHRRIFEKFFQIEDPLTRHHGGAGLGLFVAQGILEAHGTMIEIESELGSGARFRFCLPAFEIEEGTPAAEGAASDGKAKTSEPVT